MSRRPRFATYLHPETTATTKPPETIASATHHIEVLATYWPGVG